MRCEVAGPEMPLPSLLTDTAPWETLAEMEETVMEEAVKHNFQTKTVWAFLTTNWINASQSKNKIFGQEFLCQSALKTLAGARVTRCPSLRGTVPHFQDFSSVPHIETMSHIVTGRPSVFKCPNSYSPPNSCLSVVVHAMWPLWSEAQNTVVPLHLQSCPTIRAL